MLFVILMFTNNLRHSGPFYLIGKWGFIALQNRQKWRFWEHFLIFTVFDFAAATDAVSCQDKILFYLISSEKHDATIKNDLRPIFDPLTGVVKIWKIGIFTVFDLIAAIDLISYQDKKLFDLISSEKHDATIRNDLRSLVDPIYKVGGNPENQ